MSYSNMIFLFACVLAASAGWMFSFAVGLKLRPLAQAIIGGVDGILLYLTLWIIFHNQDWMMGLCTAVTGIFTFVYFMQMVWRMMEASDQRKLYN